MAFYPRPDPRYIDFTTSRFVVSSGRGIPMPDGRVIQPGEVFPSDAVRPYELQCLYRQNRIDLESFVNSVTPVKG